MSKSEIAQLLQQRHTDIRQFDVASLTLFGSTARGEARSDSDVDFLVEFHHLATFDNFMNLKLYLEDLLGRKVDLVTTNAVRDEILPNIEKDAIRVT